jgi:hypothetical protein
MVRHRLFALVLLVGLPYASAAVARCPARAAPIKMGVLVGSLLDSTSGERIRYGRVLLGSRVPVMTDTLGGFVVRDVLFGRQSLLVQGLGYASQRVDVDVAADTVRLSPIRLARAQVLERANIIAP